MTLRLYIKHILEYLHKLFGIILILAFVQVPFNSYPQKTITGVIIDPNGNPMPGAFIKGVNDSITWVSDLDGRFSFQTDDSTRELIFVIDHLNVNNQRYVKLYMRQTIREIVDIDNKDSIKCKLVYANNTIIKKPKTTKWNTLTDKTYTYKLEYNIRGRLEKVYLKNKRKKEEVDYIWELEYNKGYISISNYIIEQSDSLKRDKNFFLSQVNLFYDKNGAIRNKSVSVEYGSHHEQYNELYFYKSNKISEVLSYEYIKDWFYVNSNNFHYQKQMMLEIVQNEIFRKKLYRKSKSDDIFSTDYRIELID